MGFCYFTQPFCNKKFGGTCSSVEMLKGYMVRKKVGNPWSKLPQRSSSPLQGTATTEKRQNEIRFERRNSQLLDTRTDLMRLRNRFSSIYLETSTGLDWWRNFCVAIMQLMSAIIALLRANRLIIKRLPRRFSTVHSVGQRVMNSQPNQYLNFGIRLHGSN